jgi:hypothetical protein
VLEGLLEDVGRLRAEHDEAPVEQERGDCIDTEHVGLTGRDLDLGGVAIAGDRRLCIVETQLGSKRVQDGWVTDVQALLPVRPHEPVVRDSVPALRARELGQAEGGMRVRHDLGRRVVDEPFTFERQLEVSVESLPVPPDEVRARDAFRWVLGVKVEGQPLDLGVEPALEPLGRALTDAAERSDVVGPDQDLVGHRARLACEHVAAATSAAPLWEL